MLGYTPGLHTRGIQGHRAMHRGYRSISDGILRSLPMEKHVFILTDGFLRLYLT